MGKHRAESAARWDWRGVTASAFVLAVSFAGDLYFRGWQETSAASRSNG